MKALRRLRREARAAEVQEVSRPEPGLGEVIVQVEFCGICGSDLHTYLNHAGYESVLPQVTLGHEFSGTVVDVGPEVTHCEVGDRVTAEAIQTHLGPTDDPLVARGLTQLAPDRKVHGLHHDGGMAEYTRLHQRFVIPISDDLDFQTAALTEPTSVADHCVYDCSDIQPGDKVVVTGPGIIGMLCALVARHRGAEVLISGVASDVTIRLATARRLGLHTATVGPDQPSLGEQVKETFGREADCLIEASGAPPALAGAWEAVRADGSITVVSIFGRDVTLDFTQFIRKQIDVRTSYGSNRANFEHSLELLSQGVAPASELVRIYPLVDGIRAFTDAEHQAVMKPLLACNPPG